MKKTGWSARIVDNITNYNEYLVYRNANLHEEIINGRHCLTKDIDFDYIDNAGRSNRDRIKHHLSPIDWKTGEIIALHHMGQRFSGPLVELCMKSEHHDGNHKTLHPYTSGSWRNIPGNTAQFFQEKQNHWNTGLGGSTP